MKKIILLLGVVLLLFSIGCSAVMAVKQPEQKNLNVLEMGTHKDAVRAELGAPISTGVTVEGEKLEYDVFGFQRATPEGGELPEHFCMGFWIFFTLGLWEVVGTPLEGSISGGEKKNIRVLYNERNKVARVEDLTPQPK